MSTVMFSNFKGGAGKTTLAHHLAAAAAEAGSRVLAIDTDRQGDLYRRLTGSLMKATDRPPAEWGSGNFVRYSPQEWTVTRDEARTFSLIIIDTAPAYTPPAGLVDLLVVPIDGTDGGLNASETAQGANAARLVFVKNGTSSGGVKYGKQFDTLPDGLPDNMTVCPITLPRGDSILRSSQTCRPAWQDVYKGGDGRVMFQLCQWLLAHLASTPYPVSAPVPARARARR